MLANRLPLPSHIRSDGTQMVAKDLLDLADAADGTDEVPEWFAEQWPLPVEAVREWDDYLSGGYVCLRHAVEHAAQERALRGDRYRAGTSRSGRRRVV
jgi:hypothetical protein